MKTKSVVILVFVSCLMATGCRALPVEGAAPPTAEPAAAVGRQARVSVRAAANNSIVFWTRNGETMNGVRPEVRDIPHLVLYRNDALTRADERTLSVTVEDLPTTTAGVTVTLRVETQHGDPDLGGGSEHRISVWQQTTGVAAPAAGVSLTYTFGPEAGNVATPTDYYRLELTVWDEQNPLDRPHLTFTQEHAFLLENQWVAALPQVREETAGAAPDELVLYACDMVPFRRRVADPENWLARDEVTDYLGAELLPAMVEAYRIESEVWGFTWYEAWTSYRSGQDAERLSVALSDGETWFHGRAPAKGHGGISMTSMDNAQYDSLIDAHMSLFYHELFHNLQRNINLRVGGDGEVSGADGAWRFFSEGTAVLASSVGLPDVELTRTTVPRYYRAFASLFPLDESYEEMDPYRAALYWRFLYEQCAGVTTGVENPGAGMEVIRNALTVLYGSDVVDIRSSTDLVGNLPAVMDRALADTPLCPFSSYAESLIRFARAIYQLQLDGGRCGTPMASADCGLHDPNGIYRDPWVRRIAHAGETTDPSTAELAVQDGIQHSFGISLYDLRLDPAADGQALTFEFEAAPGADTVFSVQIWQQPSGQGPASSHDLVTMIGRPGTDGSFSYTIPVIDSEAYGRVGVIITRLDGQESSDPAGAYTLSVHR